MSAPEITVLIPAHNEAAVIHRSLTPLRELADEGLVQVIVVANGCSDDTAGIARELCPRATVLNLGAASKIIAMNEGAKLRRGRVLVCLDADLELPTMALLELVRPLRAGRADLSCGRMIPVLDQSSALVRAFYRGWALSPYFDKGKAGGVVALSDRFARDVFPLQAYTSDDEMLARLVAPSRRAFVPEAAFNVFAPRTLRALIAIRKRSRRGTLALEQAGFTTCRATNASSYLRTLARALRRPARLLDVLVYGAVIIWVRATLALEPDSGAAGWERDTSSRGEA